MKCFSLQEIPAQPWKNGGGTTRELALSECQGRMRWRISLADINQDGAFSSFPGLSRIHCIVEGTGLVLSNSTVNLAARPLDPLVFSGDLALSAQLNEGSCRAFNLIYDPAFCQAEMRVLHPNAAFGGHGERVIFLLRGELTAQTNAGEQRLRAGEGLVAMDLSPGHIPNGALVIETLLSEP